MRAHACAVCAYKPLKRHVIQKELARIVMPSRSPASTAGSRAHSKRSGCTNSTDGRTLVRYHVRRSHLAERPSASATDRSDSRSGTTSMISARSMRSNDCSDSTVLQGLQCRCAACTVSSANTGCALRERRRHKSISLPVKASEIQRQWGGGASLHAAIRGRRRARGLSRTQSGYSIRTSRRHVAGRGIPLHRRAAGAPLIGSE